MGESVFPSEMEWCNFCGYIPKGGMHSWSSHTMVNYHEEPTS